jgi:PAS domain S-box-containing protein
MPKSKLPKRVEVSRVIDGSWIDDAPDLFQSVDAYGRFIFTNKRWRKILGYSKQDLKNMTFKDVVASDQLIHCSQLFETMLKGHGVNKIETVFVSKTGKRIHIEGNVSVIRDGSKVLATRGIFRDVSARVKLENDMREHISYHDFALKLTSNFIGNKDFNSVVHTSLKDLGHLSGAHRTYIFLVDEKKQTISNTHEWCGDFVSTQRDRLQDVPLTALPWWMNKLYRNEIINIPNVSKLSEFASAEQKVLESQGIQSLIAVPLRVGKNLLGFVGLDNISSINPWGSNEEKFLSFFANILSTAIQRNNYNQELLRSEKNFKEMADLLPSIIIEIDLTGRVLYVNKAGHSIFGLAKSDVGKVNVYEFLEPFEIKRAKENFQKKLVQRGAPVEYKALTKSNKSISIVVNSVGLYENNKPVGLRCSIVDISKLKKYEEALEQFNSSLEDMVATRTKQLQTAYDKLKELDKMKDNFLSNVSHELRTPITAMKSYNQLLYSELLGKLNSDQKEALEVVLESTDHLMSIINNLLELSKYESGKSSLHLTKFKMADVVNEVCMEFKQAIHDLNGDYIFEPAKKELILNADRIKLKRLLINLFGNSIKYRSKSRSLKLILKTQYFSKQKRKWLRLSLQDNGLGITKKNLSHIFDKFYQVDESMTRHAGGEGIGLSIVKEIAELHDGKIIVESKLNHGTKFILEIPLLPLSAKKLQPDKKTVNQNFVKTTSKVNSKKALSLKHSSKKDLAKTNSIKKTSSKKSLKNVSNKALKSTNLSSKKSSKKVSKKSVKKSSKKVSKKSVKKSSKKDKLSVKKNLKSNRKLRTKSRK